MDVRPQFGSAIGSSLLIESTRLSDLSGVLGLSEDLGFSGNAWRKLIADGTAVCARNGAMAIGFYAANHLSLVTENRQLQELRAAMSVLCNRFKLAEQQIAFGARAVVVAEHAPNDLRAQMLRTLLRNIGFRYQHLFTFCRKQNPAELEMLVHEGWRCVQEEDDVCYLTLDIARTLRRLASELLLRAPLSPRTPHLSFPAKANRTGA